MSNYFLTLIIAFVLIVLALAGLAIGWLITGKTRIQGGTCGRDPHKKRDESCDTDEVSCSLCHNEPKKSDVHEREARDDSGDV